MSEIKVIEKHICIKDQFRNIILRLRIMIYIYLVCLHAYGGVSILLLFAHWHCHGKIINNKYKI